MRLPKLRPAGEPKPPREPRPPFELKVSGVVRGFHPTFGAVQIIAIRTNGEAVVRDDKADHTIRQTELIDAEAKDITGPDSGPA